MTSIQMDGVHYRVRVVYDRYPGDYDAFFAAVTAPVATHTVVMPHGQGTITYQAMVYSAQHTSRGKMAGKRRWHGLSVQFQANAPQRAPA